MNRVVHPRRASVATVLVLLLLFVLPMFTQGFFVDFVMTKTMIVGLLAVTLIFLSSNVGLVSLAQLLISGVAGFMIGNAVAEAGSKGLKLGWNDWVAVAFALSVATLIALLLGALSARSTGIYFLMLTFTFAVVGYYFFGQVTVFSGFGGITGIDPPDFFLDQPVRMYYAALALSVLAYFGFKALEKTSFGVALRGVRDDPIRMASLGFSPPMLRMAAFTVAGFVAAISGVLNVWWNGQIDPTSISTGPTLELLIIAVLGGIAHLEGAWIGAFVFVVAGNYLRNLPLVHMVGITEARFNTVVGLLVLLILVLSPTGLAGLPSGVRSGWRKISHWWSRVSKEDDGGDTAVGSREHAEKKD